MSKRIAFSFVLATILASPASSGGYAVPVIDQAVSSFVEPSPPSFRWTGAYAGFYLGKERFNLETTSMIEHDALTIEHEAVTEDVPAEVIHHQAVTDERVIEVIEHPEVTKRKVVGEIVHPPVVDTIPAVTKSHPEVRALVKVGAEEVQVGTEKFLLREDVYRDENGEKQRDESHHTGWRHVPIYEDRPVVELQPVFEERVVKEAWVEVLTPAREVVIHEGWTETLTEIVVLQEAWIEEITETVIVEEARTEVVRPAETVVVREAWTEIVRQAWSEQLTGDFSKAGNAYGIFAGYRHHWHTNFVAGLEAYHGRTSANEFQVGGETVSFGKNSYGLELQAGYAINRALPYLAVGYSNVLDHEALTLSLGLDYAVTDRLIIGTKYSRYELGEIRGSERHFEAKGDLVSLRAAIRF